MVGAELCRNEEWLQIALEVAQATMIAGTVVRTKWHPYLRWASRWFSPEVKAMRSLNDRGADLLRPEIQRRLAVGKDTHRNEDSIDWCINSFSKKGYSLNEITKKTVEFQLFFALGSIHNVCLTPPRSSIPSTTMPSQLQLIPRNFERRPLNFYQFGTT